MNEPIDTEAVRQDHFQSPHGDCHMCDDEVPLPCGAVRLCDALDEARLEARNMRLERDHAHREVADRMAERDEARAVITRIRAALAVDARSSVRVAGALAVLSDTYLVGEKGPEIVALTAPDGAA